MGNSGCCEDIGISFVYENFNNITKIILIKNEGAKKSKEIIIEDIKQKDQKFIDILNIIINNIEKIKDNKIIIIKIIKSFFTKTKIASKEEMNAYLNSIEQYMNNKYNIKAIAKISELFKLIYSKKNNIEKDGIKFIIENIKMALKETDIIENQQFDYFFEKINDIIFEKNEKNKDILLLKEAPKVIENEDREKNNNSQNKEYYTNFINYLILMNQDNNIEKKSKTYTPLINLYDFNYINTKNENGLTSQKSKSNSNFSKYTEKSKKQILKMKDEIKEYQKIISEMQKKYKDGENNKEITINYITNENKEFTLIINKNKEQSAEKLSTFFYQNPELNLNNIKIIKVNDKEIFNSDNLINI